MTLLGDGLIATGVSDGGIVSGLDVRNATPQVFVWNGLNATDIPGTDGAVGPAHSTAARPGSAWYASARVGRAAPRALVPGRISNSGSNATSVVARRVRMLASP